MGTEFLVTQRFDKSYKKLKKKYVSLPTDVAQFKKDFAENPLLGIHLTGGFRKVRLAIQSKGKGKSGGARIITYALLLKENDNTVVLVDIYDKSEKDTMRETEFIEILRDFIEN